MTIIHVTHISNKENGETVKRAAELELGTGEISLKNDGNPLSNGFIHYEGGQYKTDGNKVSQEDLADILEGVPF